MLYALSIGSRGLVAERCFPIITYLANFHVGWAKFMEWKYPVEVVVTSPKVFKGAGAIEAAASL